MEYTGGREEGDLAMLSSTTDQTTKDGSGAVTGSGSGTGAGTGSSDSSPINKLKLPAPRDMNDNGEKGGQGQGQQDPKNTKKLNFFGIPLNYLSDPTLPPGLGRGTASGQGLASTFPSPMGAAPTPTSRFLMDVESSPGYTTGGLLAVLEDDKKDSKEGDIRGDNSRADDIRGGNRRGAGIRGDNSRGADIRGGNSRGGDIRYKKLDQPVKQVQEKGNIKQSSRGQGQTQGQGLGSGLGPGQDGRLYAWDDRPPPRAGGSLRDSNRQMLDEQGGGGGGYSKPTPSNTPSTTPSNNNPSTTRKKLLKNKKTRTDGGADISDENRCGWMNVVEELYHTNP